MEVYNQNDEFVNFNIEFINGYLTSLALIKDYTTSEIGFNFYFKNIGLEDVQEALNNELRWNLNRYINEAQLNQILSYPDKLSEIKNWESNLTSKFDTWIGKGLTDAMKEERKTWHNNQNFITKDFIKVLNLFFGKKPLSVFEFKSSFKKELPIQWKWIGCIDFIFCDSKNTYLLHFDSSD